MARWPKHEALWKKAFSRYWDYRTTEKPLQRDGREWFGTAKFDTWEEMYVWWINDEPLPSDPEQCAGLLDFMA